MSSLKLTTLLTHSIIGLSLLVALPRLAKADESMATYVEVEQEPDSSLSYKERRTRHGFTFAVGKEKYFPNDYQSMQDGKYIEEFLGTTPADLMRVELGYKLNMDLGSIGLTAAFGMGEMKGSFSGLSRKISIQKKEVLGYFYADNFFNEPWVVPYVAAGAHQLSLTEQKQNADDQSVSPMAFTLRAGLGIQLNALDKRSSEDAYVEMGLENTFLDIYLVRNTSSQNTADNVMTEDGDPDTSSAFELGLGLRLEF